MQQRGRRRRQIPVFGEWNQLQLQQCEELPMTQYFESAMQAGLVVRAGRCCYHHGGTEAAALSSRSPSGSPPPHKPAKKVVRTCNAPRDLSRSQSPLWQLL